MDLLLWSDIFLDDEQECDDHDMTTGQSESEEEEDETTKRRPKIKRYIDYITAFYTLWFYLLFLMFILRFKKKSICIKDKSFNPPWNVSYTCTYIRIF